MVLFSSITLAILCKVIKLKAKTYDTGNYTEKRYGFNVGLPLIEDKLFLFTSYEKLEGIQQFNYGGLTSGSVTTDDLSRVQAASQSLYGYDAGSMPSSAPVEDEKISS